MICTCYWLVFMIVLVAAYVVCLLYMMLDFALDLLRWWLQFEIEKIVCVLYYLVLEGEEIDRRLERAYGLDMLEDTEA